MKRKRKRKREIGHSLKCNKWNLKPAQRKEREKRNWRKNYNHTLRRKRRSERWMEWLHEDLGKASSLYYIWVQKDCKHISLIPIKIQRDLFDSLFCCFAFGVFGMSGCMVYMLVWLLWVHFRWNINGVMVSNASLISLVCIEQTQEKKRMKEQKRGK